MKNGGVAKWGAKNMYQRNGIRSEPGNAGRIGGNFGDEKQKRPKAFFVRRAGSKGGAQKRKMRTAQNASVPPAAVRGAASISPTQARRGPNWPAGGHRPGHRFIGRVAALDSLPRSRRGELAEGARTGRRGFPRRWNRPSRFYAHEPRLKRGRPCGPSLRR